MLLKVASKHWWRLVFLTARPKITLFGVIRRGRHVHTLQTHTKAPVEAFALSVSHFSKAQCTRQRPACEKKKKSRNFKRTIRRPAVLCVRDFDSKRNVLVCALFLFEVRKNNFFAHTIASKSCNRPLIVPANVLIILFLRILYSTVSFAMSSIALWLTKSYCISNFPAKSCRKCGYSSSLTCTFCEPCMAMCVLWMCKCFASKFDRKQTTATKVTMPHTHPTPSHHRIPTQMGVGVKVSLPAGLISVKWTSDSNLARRRREVWNSGWFWAKNSYTGWCATTQPLHHMSN